MKKILAATLISIVFFAPTAIANEVIDEVKESPNDFVVTFEEPVTQEDIAWVEENGGQVRWYEGNELAYVAPEAGVKNSLFGRGE